MTDLEKNQELIDSLNNIKDMQRLNAQRLESNKQLIQILSILVNENPSMRFSQILSNFSFIRRYDSINGYYSWIDEYYLESKDLLERVNNTMKLLYSK